MQWYSPKNLLIVWLIPFVIWFIYISLERKKRVKEKFARHETFNKISLNYSVTKEKQRIVLFVVTLLLMELALARPQWGDQKERITRKGVNIMFLLDTSKSMLVQDMKPNRIQNAKLKIHNLVTKLKGDRIGLVAFSRDSFLICPLTLDYSAFRLFLDSVNIDSIPNEGTSVANAVNAGITSFKDNKHAYDIMIIFSDGEDHEAGIQEMAKRIQKLGIRIYAIGVGTTKGGPIPIQHDDVVENKKDKLGNIIFSRLEDKTLQKLTDSSEGLYYQATATDKEIGLIYNHIKTLEQQEFKNVMIIKKEDHFQALLLVAFILLVIEFILGERKVR
ncbi:MAG: VWA domain-containing protein [Candidatus Omnitrophica bacterium]|nr:VWA domain-containing protein [Candidatus Omnitrophota bacterium]